MSEVVNLDARRASQVVEAAMDRHPAGTGRLDDKEMALRDLSIRHEILKAAKAEYEKALFRCKDLEIANTVIARRVGLTEAAIRMYVRRKREK